MITITQNMIETIISTISKTYYRRKDSDDYVCQLSGQYEPITNNIKISLLSSKIKKMIGGSINLGMINTADTIYEAFKNEDRTSPKVNYIINHIFNKYIVDGEQFRLPFKKFYDEYYTDSSSIMIEYSDYMKFFSVELSKKDAAKKYFTSESNIYLKIRVFILLAFFYIIHDTELRSKVTDEVLILMNDEDSVNNIDDLENIDTNTFKDEETIEDLTDFDDEYDVIKEETEEIEEEDNNMTDNNITNEELEKGFVHELDKFDDIMSEVDDNNNMTNEELNNKIYTRILPSLTNTEVKSISKRIESKEKEIRKIIKDKKIAKKVMSIINEIVDNNMILLQNYFNDTEKSYSVIVEEVISQKFFINTNKELTENELYEIVKKEYKQGNLVLDNPNLIQAQVLLDDDSDWIKL